MKTISVLLLALLLAACQAENPEFDLQTVIAQTSAAPVVKTQPVTKTYTLAPSATLTPSATPSPTWTKTPTKTPIPTITSSPTPQPTGGGSGKIYYLAKDGLYWITPNGSKPEKIYDASGKVIFGLQGTENGKTLAIYDYKNDKTCRITPWGGMAECKDRRRNLSPQGTLFLPEQYPFIPVEFQTGSISQDGDFVVGTVHVKKKYIELVVVDLKNKTSTTINKARNGILNPSLSRDGSKIIFGKRPASNKMELFVINRDGSGEKQLTYFGGHISLNNQLSPDGVTVATLGLISMLSCVSEISLIDVKTTRIKGLTNRMRVCDYTWSPDSKHIVFSADPDKDEVYEIYRIDVESKEVTKLVKNLSSISGIIWR